jgi:hypothetical protein
MKLWVVFRYRSSRGDAVCADFQGVFSTEAKAVAACRNWRYSVCPATLNESLPDGLEKNWPGAYYPHKRSGAK